MSPSDQSQIVQAFADLVEHHCPRGAGYDAIGHEDGTLWSALAEGGWLDVGALAAGEDALPLVTLAVMMIEWGRRLPRLPFASAVLARRRFAIGLQDATRHVVALEGRDGVLIPFGATLNTCLLDGAGDPVPSRADAGDEDDFDPTLALTRCAAGAVPGWSSELQVLLAGQAVGAAAEALDRAIDYAQQRQAFGRPISGFQSLRHWLSDMHIAFELAQSGLLWAVRSTGTERAHALGECSRQAQAVATKAIQVFGGVGCSWELGLHAYLRHTIAVREVVSAAQPQGDDGAVAADRVATDGGEDAAFRAEVSGWLDRAVSPEWRETKTERTADDLAAMKQQWARIRQEGGFSGLRWPREYGGRGLTPREVMIYYEECAKARVPEGVDGNPRAIGQDLAGPAIIAYGTPTQKARHLPRIFAGEEIWCEGFSEPGAGSDLAAVTTSAVFDGSVYRINGSKIWTTYAHHADYCYLLARTSPDAPRRENLSVFLFDMRQPGVRVRPIPNLVGEHEFNQVFLDDAIAEPGDLLGELNDGWKMVTIGAKALRSSGKDGGTTVAWQRCTQLATWLDRLDATVADAGTHDRIAGLRARLDALRWTNARNAGIHDAESWFPPVRGASNIVKLGISEVLQELTELGVATAPHEHQPFWRREFMLARARTIAGGSSQIQRDVIAKQVLHLRSA